MRSRVVIVTVVLTSHLAWDRGTACYGHPSLRRKPVKVKLEVKGNPFQSRNEWILQTNSPITTKGGLPKMWVQK